MSLNPIDNMRGRFDNIRAHPYQALMRGLAGAVNPALGILADRGFSAYNNRQFNNANTALSDRMQQQGQRAQDAAMNKPLNGPLGQAGGNDNSALAGALMGGGNMPNMGSWNMSQFGPASSSGGLVNQLLAGIPRQPSYGPNLSGLDAALAARPGSGAAPPAPATAGAGAGGGMGGGGSMSGNAFAGGMNWGGGTGGAMLSNLGMASGVQGFGGWGGTPTGLNNLNLADISII